MTTVTESTTVLAAYDIGRGRVRAVVVRGDGKISVADGPAKDGEAGKALFPFTSFTSLTAFAERCLAGDARAVTHPKAIMVLAAAIVASVAVANLEPKGQTHDAPR